MPYVKKAYRPRRKAPFRAKRRNPRRTRASSMPLVLSKLRTLERTRETKCIQTYSASTPITCYQQGAYGGAANTLTVIQLGPNALTLPISQGSGQANRVGNKIETKKATIKMMFTPIAYNSVTNKTPNPQIVKIWGLWFKQGDYSGAPPANMAHFFQSGNTSIVPQGNLLDDFLTVNKQAYSVAFTRTVKVGNAKISTSSNSNFNNQNQAFANNDFKLSAKIVVDYTKHLIKMQKFNDTDTEPSIRQLFLVVESISATNDVNATSGHPVDMVYEIDYRFQDA
jgi:hypothetical protein